MIFPSAVLSVLRTMIPIIPLLSVCKASRVDFQYYVENWFRVNMNKFRGNPERLKRVRIDDVCQLHHTINVIDVVFGTNICDSNPSIDKLPATITHLTFGYDFNQCVDKLPPLLTHLTFGDDFNQPLGSSLNNCPLLTHIIFGDNFN